VSCLNDLSPSASSSGGCDVVMPSSQGCAVVAPSSKGCDGIIVAFVIQHQAKHGQKKMSLPCSLPLLGVYNLVALQFSSQADLFQSWDSSFVDMAGEPLAT
jgi:hypothetical protein